MWKVHISNSQRKFEWCSWNSIQRKWFANSPAVSQNKHPNLPPRLPLTFQRTLLTSNTVKRFLSLKKRSCHLSSIDQPDWPRFVDANRTDRIELRRCLDLLDLGNLVLIIKRPIQMLNSMKSTRLQWQIWRAKWDQFTWNLSIRTPRFGRFMNSIIWTSNYEATEAA